MRMRRYDQYVLNLVPSSVHHKTLLDQGHPNQIGLASLGKLRVTVTKIGCPQILKIATDLVLMVQVGQENPIIGGPKDPNRPLMPVTQIRTSRHFHTR